MLNFLKNRKYTIESVVQSDESDEKNSKSPECASTSVPLQVPVPPPEYEKQAPLCPNNIEQKIQNIREKEAKQLLAKIISATQKNLDDFLSGEKTGSITLYSFSNDTSNIIVQCVIEYFKSIGYNFVLSANGKSIIYSIPNPTDDIYKEQMRILLQENKRKL